MNGNDNVDKNLKLWQILVGQLPWFLTVLALGAWYTSRLDARLVALERSMARVEARQELAQIEKLEDMRQEVERMRKVVGR